MSNLSADQWLDPELEADLAHVGPPVCDKCSNEKSYLDCWNCGGEGYSHHDCGEDCCCCLHPEDNVECDICEGDGGYYVCANCHPGSFDDY